MRLRASYPLLCAPCMHTQSSSVVYPPVHSHTHPIIVNICKLSINLFHSKVLGTLGCFLEFFCQRHQSPFLLSERTLLRFAQRNKKANICSRTETQQKNTKKTHTDKRTAINLRYGYLFKLQEAQPTVAREMLLGPLFQGHPALST